jgi:hypothetical protein
VRIKKENKQEIKKAKKAKAKGKSRNIKKQE